MANQRMNLKHLVLLFLLCRIMGSFWSSGIQEEEVCVSQVIFPCVISTAEPKQNSAFEKLLPSVGRIEQD
jgi:hypothetical protein